jgi:hypothetical protein
MTLVILSLLISGALLSARAEPLKRIRSARAPAPRRLPEAPPRGVDRNYSLDVEGRGLTEKDAEQNALKGAQDEVRVFLAEQNHSFEWRPSLDYINNHLVKKSDPLPPEDFGDPLGTLQGVVLHLEIGSKDWQDMLRQDRLARADSRMLLLAKLLVGLVALLGAVAGYLRLEEMTKGYYTAWLRFTAIAFVTAVGAGIWLIS